MQWSNWKLALITVLGGITLASLIILGIIVYWRMETPRQLPQVKELKFADVPARSSIVIDVPAREYEYLGPFAFSTRTLDSRGNIVWSTQWVRYSSTSQYKLVTPQGLEPGLFSVTLNLDYRLNPVTRAQGEVKFLDLMVRKEEK